jgi:hypothetical protein
MVSTRANELIAGAAAANRRRPRVSSDQNAFTRLGCEATWATPRTETRETAVTMLYGNIRGQLLNIDDEVWIDSELTPPL